MLRPVATSARLERATSSSAGKRSNPLSYEVISSLAVYYTMLSPMLQIAHAGNFRVQFCWSNTRIKDANMRNAPDLGAHAPWKQRFRLPHIAATALAKANPARGLVIGKQQAAATEEVYAWDVSTAQLRPLLGSDVSIIESWIDPAGRYVYFLHDPDGSELGHLMRVPFEGGPMEDLTPDLPPYTLRGMGFSHNGARLAFNPVNADGFQIYCIELDPEGTPDALHQLYRSPFETWESFVSADAQMVVTQSTERAGGKRQYSMLILAADSGTLLAELWDGPGTSVEPVAFSPRIGDPRVLATTTRHEFIRPLIWNPLTGERIDLDSDLEGEIVPLDWSDDGERVLLCQIYQATQRLQIWNLVDGSVISLNHPDGTLYIPLVDTRRSYFGPGNEVFCLWEDSAHPAQLIALDAHNAAAMRTVLSFATTLPPSRPWRSVTFRSSDGQEVQGWLGLPDGEGPFPTILDIHGGPHIAMTNLFVPQAQLWQDHGFAFLTINYRGSTTFGRRFKEQIWGDIGHWEIEDMVAARNWLVEQGIARSDAIFLQGGSYGGFLTLLGLGKCPELWAGGCAIAAIGDAALNYEDASDALKGAMRAWFGGTPAERPEVYAAGSPISYVAQLQAPVFIIQGRTDSRTTARQMEAYVEKLRALGKSVEIEWFDAGHGIGSSPEQMIGFCERQLMFVWNILQSRS